MEEINTNVSPQAVKREQIRLLYRGLFISFMANPFISVMLVYFLWDRVSNNQYALYWFCSIILLVIIRLHGYIQFNRIRDESFDTDHWYKRYLISLIVSSLAWGASSWVLFPENDPAFQGFLALTLAALIAGSLAVLVYRLEMFLLFMGINLGLLSIRLVLDGSELSLSIVVALFVFMFYIIISSRHIFQLIKQNIEMRLVAADSHETLRRLQQRQASHDQNTPMAVIECDTNLLVSKWNEAACKIFGYARRDVIGKSLVDLLVSENDKQGMVAYCRELFSSGESQRIEYASRLADGRSIDCIWHLTPLSDREGNVNAMVATALDVSTLKHTERALTQTRDIALQASRTKSEFLASMSHELRTPLNTVLGFSELLIDECTDEEHIQHAQLINKAGVHLLGLINDVLDLSKIEAGKMEMHPKRFKLNSVLSDCIKLLKPIADKKGIDLRYYKEDCNAAGFVDPNRLKQCVINLISNAIKYNQSGGYVEVKCLSQSGGQLLIMVEDNGEGIADDMQEHLFIPFERLGAEASTIQGTGIGLSITRKMIEMMGGSIGFESIADKGSQFWLEIPGSAEAVMEKTGIYSTVEIGVSACLTQPYTLLYIEDNVDNMRLMEHIIANNTKITLLNAQTAESGIELACQQQPDLVLLDINLPGMDGYEAVVHLKNLAETRHIPVIGVSANAMQSDIDKALSAGFDAYLTKPISIKNLLGALEKYLPRAA